MPDDAYTPLEEAARAATPGPWKWEDWDREKYDTERPLHQRHLVNETPRGGEGTGSDLPAVVAVTEDPRQWWHNPADARFIAAAHPQAVLDLIEKAREAERLRAYFDQFAWHVGDGTAPCPAQFVHEPGPCTCGYEAACESLAPREGADV